MVAPVDLAVRRERTVGQATNKGNCKTEPSELAHSRSCPVASYRRYQRQGFSEALNRVRRGIVGSAGTLVAHEARRLINGDGPDCGCWFYVSTQGVTDGNHLSIVIMKQDASFRRDPLKGLLILATHDPHAIEVFPFDI